MFKAVLPLPPGWFKARLYHLLAPVVALALIALFEQTRLAELLEYMTVNLRFVVRAPFDPDADPRLVFVGIDQESLDKFGMYPWPRTKIAKFLTDMVKCQANPHTVAFDIMYTEKSSDPADDEALGNAVALLPSVITGALSVDPSGDTSVIKASEEKTRTEMMDPGSTAYYTHIQGDPGKIRGSNIATLPVDPVRKSGLFGFVNDEASPVDYIRHTIPLVIRVGDKIYPSLALQALCEMLHVDADKVEVNVGKNVILKNSSGKVWTIPVNERGEYLINYRRNSSFTNLSFGLLADQLDISARTGAPLPKDCNLEKKTILIGEAATALIDLGPTPLQAQSPLPYTHLDVINNVLKNDYLTFVPWPWVVIVWALTTWITLLRLKEAPLIEAVFAPITLMVVYILSAFAIFWLWSIQIALAWPIIGYAAVNFGGVVLRWREEQQERQKVKHLFSHMVSPEIMNHLLEHPENMKLGGENRAVTILFSDIREYTRFSEGLTAAEVVRQLNVYFERMVACVTECKGTFHKFIGDAVMAAWGDIAEASLGPEQDARNAVRSALQMREKLRQLNTERQAENLVPLRIGIGLNHGIVQAAMLGATGRMEFTVMGDEVNVASRLEGITKEFHTDLVVSESVRALLGDDFLVRRVGLRVLKGKTKPTMIYEVLAETKNASDSKLSANVIAHYEAAFDHFLARRFVEAAAGFQTCDQLSPGDYNVTEYLKASRAYLAEPPPPEWDGVIVMKTK